MTSLRNAFRIAMQYSFLLNWVKMIQKCINALECLWSKFYDPSIWLPLAQYVQDRWRGCDRRRLMWEGDNVEGDGRTLELVGKIYDFLDEDIFYKHNMHTIRSWYGNATKNLSWRYKHAQNLCKFFFPRFSVVNRRKEVLVTAGIVLMVIKTVSCLPYIPDISLCEFWFSGKMKKNLIDLKTVKRWRMLWSGFWKLSHLMTCIGQSLNNWSAKIWSQMILFWRR